MACRISPGTGITPVSDQADMVAEFIRTQDLHDLVVMGHSMGGGVTLMTYFKMREENPGRIKRLVLIDSAGYPQKLPWFIRLAGFPCSIPWEPGCCRPGSPPAWS